MWLENVLPSLVTHCSDRKLARGRHRTTDIVIVAAEIAEAKQTQNFKTINVYFKSRKQWRSELLGDTA